MSGAEAATAIQLIDACIGIATAIISIGRAVRDAQGLPPKLRDLLETLPVIEELLESAHERFDDGNIDEATDNDVRPMLKQCEQRLAELRTIFRKACPTNDDNRGKRIWKGAKTVFFGRDSKVQSLLLGIQENLKLLEEKEIFSIGDKLDDLRELTEALGQDDTGKYSHSGQGNIITNEGSGQTNYVQSGKDARQIFSYGSYHEAVTIHTHHHAAPERPETPPDPSHNIPFPRDPEYVERTTLTDQLHIKLSDQAARVALVGLGGVGKSQLAVSFARELRRRSPQTWVLWIHANNVTRFEDDIYEIADLLKIPGRKSAEANFLQLLQNRLRDERKGKWLIVLDSADDVGYLFTRPPDAGRSVERRIEYFPRCDHGTMLITTRSRDEALAMVYQSDIIPVPPMSDVEAESLLNNKLGQLDPGSWQLVRSLEFMPLAITQAAAFIQKQGPHYSVHMYRETIEQSRITRKGLLQRDFRDLGRDFEASNSILLTWQTSFEFLKRTRPSGARLLSLMSFCDRFSMPEILLNVDSGKARSPADDLLSDFAEDIVALRSLCFISDVYDQKAWQMHRLVQDATQMWLEDHLVFDRTQGRFIHCLHLALTGYEVEHWPVCRVLYSHAKEAMKQRPLDENARLEWATVMHDFAWYANRQANYNDTLAMASAAMDVHGKVLGPHDPSTLQSSHLVAWASHGLGHLLEAEKMGKRVLEARTERFGPGHADTLESRRMLGETYRKQGRWKEAERLLRGTLEVSRSKQGESDQMTLSAKNELASTLNAQGEWAVAAKLYEQILEVGRAERPGHPDTLTVIHNLAWTYTRQGRWQDATALFREAIEGRRRVLDEGHPNTLLSLSGLCSLYIRQKRWKEAEQLSHEVLSIRKRVSGEATPDALNNLNELGVAYNGQGRCKEAEQVHREVLQLRTELLGENHGDTLTSKHNLAVSLERLGQLAEAEKLLSEAVEVSKRVSGAEHPDTLDSMSEYARVLQKQGRLDEAAEQKARLLEISTAKLGVDHPNTLSRMHNLAASYAAQGRLAEAEKLQTEAVDGYTRFNASRGAEHPDTRTVKGELAKYRQWLEQEASASRAVVRPSVS